LLIHVPYLIPVAEDTLPTDDGYVIDKASGRLVIAGPEEVEATQPLLEILIREAGWSPEQIQSRPQWRVPPSPSAKRRWPVDVAVFDKPEHKGNEDHVLMICECKRPDEASGIRQLKTYLDREPHARLGVWFNGIEHKIVYKTTDGYEVAPDGTPIPTPQDPLQPIERRALTYDDLRKPPSLIPVFRRIRDRLATLDTNVNRDEEILPDLSLLLLLKILDEQEHQFKSSDPLRLQVDETPEATAARVADLLERQVARHPELFGVNQASFQIDDASIHYVIENLQNYRLLGGQADAISNAFQVIRGKAYKGEEGQFFTPPSVVEVAIAAVDPQPEDRIIDPACGSGSFLAAALENVVDHLRDRYGDGQQALKLALSQWAKQQLYAIDKDAVSVRLSKAFLSMLGDGSTHVYKADAVRPSIWPGKVDAHVNKGSFDIVVTNPPFGTKLKVTSAIGREEGYDLSRKWSQNDDGVWERQDDFKNRDLGLIFLELSMMLLEPGGRLAIVLPDTYLFSVSYSWLVQWLSQYRITHLINVPIEAFEPHCRAKTGVVVVEKSPPPIGHQIICSVCRTYGEDKYGRPLYKIVEGKQTTELDDEMKEAAELLRGEPPEDESRLYFHVSQQEAIGKEVLVPSFYWRTPCLDRLRAFADAEGCDLVRVGDLMDAGQLEVHTGHGSPPTKYRAKGPVPYVKVSDIKNWRLNENPSNFIPTEVAETYRRGKWLQPYDLVTPTRASKNIGLFAVVMPWQTNVILTREIEVWRLTETAERVNPFLLLTLLSLKVVHDQFDFLVLMQTNREDLSQRYRELLLPIPREEAKRTEWTKPLRDYFEARVRARESYDELLDRLDPDLFVDRP
jgi:type I restriction enzyme M protein